MKTPMQGLIEFIELNIDDNDFIKHQVLEEADKAIKIEKEHIINAFEVGYKSCDLDEAFEINRKLASGENYYNKTYNI